MSDFDAFARDYATGAERRPAPAVVELLGDVAGLRILDAGCGPGVHLETLLRRGASSATGIDESERMLEAARERLGNSADLLPGDLAVRLGDLGDASFDRVLLSGVLHHLDDPGVVLAEIRRVLAPRGRLAVSTHHPTADWLQFGGSYFGVETVEQSWGDHAGISVRRAPLEVLVAEFREAGFLIESIVEPRPSGGHGSTGHGGGAERAGTHPPAAGFGADRGRGEDAPGAIAFALVPR